MRSVADHTRPMGRYKYAPSNARPFPRRRRTHDRPYAMVDRGACGLKSATTTNLSFERSCGDRINYERSSPASFRASTFLDSSRFARATWPSVIRCTFNSIGRSYPRGSQSLQGSFVQALGRPSVVGREFQFTTCECGCWPFIVAVDGPSSIGPPTKDRFGGAADNRPEE